MNWGAAVLFYNRITVILIVLISGFLNSCYQQSLLYHEKLYVFGTIVEITTWGVPEDQASGAVNTVAKEFQTMHQNWHAWHPSPLTQLNQAIRSGQKRTIEDSLIPLLEQTKHFYQLSDGLFNPAIGQLIALWGFHHDELPVGPPPSAQAIAELVAFTPGMDALKIIGHEIECSNPAVQLDVGAVAKGYAIDLAIERLRSFGINNAIVNAGGNLKVIGRKGNQPWTIGIRHPSGKGVLASLTTEGEESIVTSGNYERYREYQGTHYSHIIDPRTGWPVQDLTSVTVIHPNGALADAASTALTIAGLSDWQKIAQRMDIHYVMLVDKAGTVYMNPAMAQRVQFDPQNQPKIVITKE